MYAAFPLVPEHGGSSSRGGQVGKRPRSHRSQGQEAGSGQRLPSRVCPENSWFLVSVSLASVGTNHASANRGVWGEAVGASVSVL